MIALSAALNMFELNCCDQLWYRSSVTKCDAYKYTKCTKNLLAIPNGFAQPVVQSDGKILACSKANKMGFPVKPECLNLTP